MYNIGDLLRRNKEGHSNRYCVIVDIITLKYGTTGYRVEWVDGGTDIIHKYELKYYFKPVS